MRTLTAAEVHVLETHAVLIDESVIEITGALMMWDPDLDDGFSGLHEALRNELCLLVAKATDASTLPVASDPSSAGQSGDVDRDLIQKELTMLRRLPIAIARERLARLFRTIGAALALAEAADEDVATEASRK